MSSDERALLRHTVATLAYRSRRVLLDVPTGFESFRPSEGARSAGEVLAHMGDLFDWALHMVEGKQVWKDSTHLPWKDEVSRFYLGLRKLDTRLGEGRDLAVSAGSVFQGPIADALTHLGQVALLRRLAMSPVGGENYFRAEIVAGRIEPDTQAPPRREF